MIKIFEEGVAADPLPQLRYLLLQRVVFLGHLADIIRDKLRNGPDEQGTLDFAITEVELFGTDGNSTSAIEKLRIAAEHFTELTEHFQSHDTEELENITDEIGSIADLLELIAKKNAPAIKKFLQDEVDDHRESADRRIGAQEFFASLKHSASVVDIRPHPNIERPQLYRGNLEIFEFFLRMIEARYPDK